MKSVANRIYDIYVDKREFLPEGQTEPIKYVQLVLNVKLNGEEDEVRLKLTRDQAKILQAASIIDDEASFLDEEVATKK